MAVAAIDRPKRDGRTLARGWSPTCRADQPSDPNGILLFDDYSPFTRGEGPLGQLIASLSDNIRSALTEHMRSAYLSSRPDGPRSIPCVAWACRGTVPA